MPASHAAPSPSATTPHAGHRRMAAQHYGRLLLMTALSFVAMYFLMYAMVDGFDSYYNNINHVYMAGLMAAAMVAIELGVMRSMYPSRGLNIALVAGSIVALGVCWSLIREQG